MSDIDYGDMSIGEMLTHLGTDAEKWADAFCWFNPHLDATSAVPGDTIHAWFANAIEAGRSAGVSPQPEEKPCPECSSTDGWHDITCDTGNTEEKTS